MRNQGRFARELAARNVVCDTRGGAYVEFLIVILPLLTLALGIFQLSQLYTAKLAVDHAAANAARAATVVMSDDPKYYGGEAVNSAGSARTSAVRLAAARTLAPFVLDGSLRTVDVTFPNGIPTSRGQDLTVQVTSDYRCSVPLVHKFVCSGGNGTLKLIGRATMASNAANFQY